MKTRLEEHYHKNIHPSMVEKFKYKNKFEVPKLTKVVINIGVGEAVKDSKKIDSAIKELDLIFSNINKSSTYQTKAVGFEGDDFLNSIICGISNDNFEELNVKLKMIEDKSGRDRSMPKFSARTLDIDIVLQINDDEEILFESDEVEKYSFVSEPLKELL